MTYRELRDRMNTLTDEQLQQTVTVEDAEEDEYYPIDSVEETDVDNDVLDEGHIVLLRR